MRPVDCTTTFGSNWDGVFRSWAVTKGPSLDPRVKRLAVEVEDHPLDYGDFEGTIPKGEYGGGTVQLWDRGFWAPLPGTNLRAALKAGQLKFLLEGSRLKGEWVLVRMKRDRAGGKRSNWLLIKHADQYARRSGDALLKKSRSVASGRTLAQIAAGQGPRATPFMRTAIQRAAACEEASGSCAGGEAARVGAAAIRAAAARTPRRARARPKPAGVMRSSSTATACRCASSTARRSCGRARVSTGPVASRRSQRPAESCRTAWWTAKYARWMRGACRAFAALQAALMEEDTPELVYFVFDLLHADGMDFRPQGVEARKRRLAEILKPKAVRARLRYVEHFETAADALLKSACRMSLEGVVSKRLDAPYRSGRGDAWQKTKCRAGQEVVIGGWTVRDRQLRSLLAGVHRRGRFTYVGRIGTGFGQKAAGGLLAKLRSSRKRHESVRGEGRAAEIGRDPLGEAAAGRGNRLRRLDRCRHAPAGGLQGIAGR